MPLSLEEILARQWEFAKKVEEMDVDSLEWHNEPVLQDLLEAKQARIDAEVAMIGALGLATRAR